MNGSREELIKYLKSRNIEVGIHFYPANKYSLFNSVSRGDLSVTEKVSQEILTLPLHTNMAMDDVDRVQTEVRNFYS